MFFNYRPLCTALLIVVGNVIAEFVTISSTDRSKSDSERDYKYPMYQEVAPLPCDLTTSCDAFCCEDPDCEEHQVSHCLKPTYNCDEFLSFFDCNCDNFDKPEWLSVFCFVYKNPIYLGKFFNTPRKIEKISTLKNVISKNSLFHQNENMRDFKAKTTNTLGAPMMTFVPASDSFPSVNPLLWKIPLKDSTHACTSGSVNYRVNGETFCFVKVSQQLCENGHALGILPFLVQSSDRFNNSNIPVVLKDSDFLEGLNTEVAIKCVNLKLKAMRFKSQILHFFQESNTKECFGLQGAHHTSFANNTCLNALVYVQYHFTVNGSDIIELKAEYGLTNISLPIDNKNNSFKINEIKKYNYLKQRFSVYFFDIMNMSYDNQNHSTLDDIIYNRGYFIGEQLNFGYKVVTNSSTTWRKGILGVFGSGSTEYVQQIKPYQLLVGNIEIGTAFEPIKLGHKRSGSSFSIADKAVMMGLFYCYDYFLYRMKL